jgi:hypothetical protein
MYSSPPASQEVFNPPSGSATPLATTWTPPKRKPLPDPEPAMTGDASGFDDERPSGEASIRTSDAPADEGGAETPMMLSKSEAVIEPPEQPAPLDPDDAVAMSAAPSSADAIMREHNELTAAQEGSRSQEVHNISSPENENDEVSKIADELRHGISGKAEATESAAPDIKKNPTRQVLGEPDATDSDAKPAKKRRNRKRKKKPAGERPSGAPAMPPSGGADDMAEDVSDEPAEAGAGLLSHERRLEPPTLMPNAMHKPLTDTEEAVSLPVRTAPEKEPDDEETLKALGAHSDPNKTPPPPPPPAADAEDTIAIDKDGNLIPKDGQNPA